MSIQLKITPCEIHLKTFTLDEWEYARMWRFPLSPSYWINEVWLIFLFFYFFVWLRKHPACTVGLPNAHFDKKGLSFGPRPHIYLFKRELSLYFQISTPEENHAVKGLDCGHENISSPHASVSLFFFKSLRRIYRRQMSYYGSPTFRWNFQFWIHTSIFLAIIFVTSQLLLCLFWMNLRLGTCVYNTLASKFCVELLKPSKIYIPMPKTSFWIC